ncbi:ABC transporter ATP-binding protein/permease [Olsenella massiliensis]|uniref:ABC transporter ATP-binding protein/permease n=1 Tax=Olsenella massiliensis TaxID=1622075 RepID=UPI0009EA272F|nr:ATP-binding cassette domain-containing protein [Olsenella massiliensis]
MIRKRLFDLAPDALRHALLAAGASWLGLVSDVVLAGALARALADLSCGAGAAFVPLALVAGLAALPLRVLAVKRASAEGWAASREAKRSLRHRLHEKLLVVGPGYDAQVSTAKVVQLAVEGCEQLEAYFGKYLPQLAFSLLAPPTLVVALVALEGATWPAALTLLACVPLIPLTIMATQKVARRLLGAYWDEYVTLGDSFLENLQGLTTLKIYQADAARHEAMDAESERFRVVTMRVLRMQLNSIIVMDVMALGGAALGIAVALGLLSAGSVSLFGALLVALLSADFFLPLRALGSHFHVAMNGLAAADAMFAVLDLPEPSGGGTADPAPGDHLRMSHVDFSWDGEREVLHDVSIDVPSVGLTALVGASGSGKSTIASLLRGAVAPMGGTVLLGGRPLSDYRAQSLARYVTLVPSSSYLFAGTVRDNLLMGDPDAPDDDLWQVLASVRLDGYLRAREGLDTVVEAQGESLSGGQRQRLALARALLRNSPVYILDEATSNIDVESEEAIMAAVRSVARYKAVVLISHRLSNVTKAREVHVLDGGRVVGAGSHERLLADSDDYRALWEAQRALENFTPRARAGRVAFGPAGPIDPEEAGDADAE